MVETKTITISSIGIVLMIITSLGTMYVQDSEDKTGCRSGWILEENGVYEGYNKCITTTNVRYEMCYEVYDSANTENYWCKKGILIDNKDIEEKQLSVGVCANLGYTNQAVCSK